MHTWCEISQKNLQQNFRELRSLIKSSQLAPVLKSDAYGHGLPLVYQSLEKEKPKVICVNYLVAAKQLRDLGYKGRIFIVGPCLPYELKEAYEYKVELIIGAEGLLRKWLEAEEKCTVHLKFDTGLSRQGLMLDKAEDYWASLANYQTLIKGICTHFADTEDVTHQHYGEKQLARLKEVTRFFEHKGLKYELHAAASAATLLMHHSRLDICRVGISLYGFWPSNLTKLSFLTQHKKLIELKPALSWHTRVVSVRRIKAGTFVGYGCSYKASSEMSLATISVGYYEGYPRSASLSGSYVLCQGKRCPVLGRVCMNMIIIDVSSCFNVEVGEQVTLIGTQEKETILAEDLAGWADTIQYEIVSRIHPDVRRVLV